MTIQFVQQQQIAYSRRDITSLNISLIELQNVYNSHFKNLNLRCMYGQITQQEFFDEQCRLANLMKEITAIKAEIEQFNQTNNVNHGRLTQEERKQVIAYYQTGNYTQIQLASMFGVAQSTIHAICS